MIEVASLIIVNLVIASIIGFLIGFLAGRVSNNSNAFSNNKDIVKNRKDSTSLNPVFKKNSGVYNKPLILSAPRFLKKDDLTRIKSIDVAMEQRLNAMGIFHYDQISKWSSRNCDWADELLSLHGYSRDNNWISQAKILETGQETAFTQSLIDEKEALENSIKLENEDENIEEDKNNKKDEVS